MMLRIFLVFLSFSSSLISHFPSVCHFSVFPSLYLDMTEMSITITVIINDHLPKLKDNSAMCIVVANIILSNGLYNRALQLMSPCTYMFMKL